MPFRHWRGSKNYSMLLYSCHLENSRISIPKSAIRTDVEESKQVCQGVQIRCDFYLNTSWYILHANSFYSRLNMLSRKYILCFLVRKWAYAFSIFISCFFGPLHKTQSLYSTTNMRTTGRRVSCFVWYVLVKKNI